MYKAGPKTSTPRIVTNNNMHGCLIMLHMVWKNFMPDRKCYRNEWKAVNLFQRNFKFVLLFLTASLWTHTFSKKKNKRALAENSENLSILMARPVKKITHSVALANNILVEPILESLMKFNSNVHNMLVLKFKKTLQHTWYPFN